MSNQINMAKGFNNKKCIGVTCPECGAGGGNKYPCWCHFCHEKGEKVMMLPSCNKRIISNWSESIK